MFDVDVGGGVVYCCGNGIGRFYFVYCFCCVVYCLLFQWYSVLGINLVGVVWCIIIIGC